MKRYNTGLEIKEILFSEPDIVIYRMCFSPYMNWHDKVYSEFVSVSQKQIHINIPVNITKGLIIFEYYSSRGFFYTLISKKNIDLDQTLSFNNIEFEKTVDTHDNSIPACEYPWLNPVINSSGDLTICCNDPFFEETIGNICEKDIKRLWFEDEKIKKIRYSHIVGDLTDVKICKRCIGKKSKSVDKDIIREYSQQNPQISNIYRYYNARLSKKIIFEYLFLELTDNCNLLCNFCNQKYSDWEKVHGIKQKGFMDYKKLELFIKEYKKNIFFNTINLFWLGEPLLNKNLPDILELLQNNQDFFCNCELHTNGTLIDKRFIECLLKLDFPINIHISCDAFTEKTYNKVKSGYDIEDTFNNIKDIVVYLKEKNNITVVIQYIVFKDNKDELYDFIDYWEEFFKNNNFDYQITTYFDFIKKNIIYIRYCDAIEKQYDENNRKIFDEIRNNMTGTKVGYIDYKSCHKGVKPSFCTDPFEFVVVRYDGLVTHCCHDTAMKNSDINIFESDFNEFRHSLLRFFERFIDGNCDICKNCDMYKSENTHRTTLNKILDIMVSIEAECSELLKKVLVCDYENKK